MFHIGDDPRLKAALDAVRKELPSDKARGLSSLDKVGILEACRQGTAPLKGLSELAVGLDETLEGSEAKLGSIADGSSGLMVINGPFGMGKTFLLRFLFDRALDLGFAASFVTLTVRECPLHDLSTVYRQIMRGLRTGYCRDRSALERILASWSDQVRGEAVAIQRVPWTLRKLNAEFKAALTAYYEGFYSGQGRKTDVALRWLQADDPDMRSSKALGLVSQISDRNALDMLGNLTLMLRHIGLRGLVVVMDEIDSLATLQSATLREHAFANLTRMADANVATPYSYFVYATTPAVFGGSAIPRHLHDLMQGATLHLEALRRSDLEVLAWRLRGLHREVHGTNDGSTVARKVLMSFVARYAAKSNYK